MKKIILVIIVLAIIGGIWYWSQNKMPAAAPANNSAAAANVDSTASIESSLNSVDTSVQADVKAMNDTSKGY